jgi:hypothetical protein
MLSKEPKLTSTINFPLPLKNHETQDQNLEIFSQTFLSENGRQITTINVEESISNHSPRPFSFKSFQQRQQQQKLLPISSSSKSLSVSSSSLSSAPIQSRKSIDPFVQHPIDFDNQTHENNANILQNKPKTIDTINTKKQSSREKLQNLSYEITLTEDNDIQEEQRLKKRTKSFQKEEEERKPEWLRNPRDKYGRKPGNKDQLQSHYYYYHHHLPLFNLIDFFMQ